MNSGDTPNAGAGGNPKPLDPVLQKRAIASKLRGARKREFAILREHMRKGEHTPSMVAGMRGQAVRERPASDQTLKKIDRIGAHLEALWNPGAAKPTTKATLAQAAKPAPATSANQLEPSTWIPTNLVIPPLSQLADPGPLSLLLDLPSHPLAPPAATETAQSPLWHADPLMRELAGLLALGKYPAVQKLLLSALDPQSERTWAKHAQALILLDTYRFLADMDGFDDTVLAYVHWWNGLAPSWDLPAASDAAYPWVLEGTIHGASGLVLPELDWSHAPQKIDIDCSALRHMDLQATKALLQWLESAKKRNYEVILNAPSPLVYLVWSTLDLEKFAHVHNKF